nr:MAG TPA: hypothetical protein [Caudoviricetes sp.]
MDDCPTLRIFVTLIRSHTLIATFTGKKFLYIRESSFKVRSVTRTANGDSSFCPCSLVGV